MNTTLLHKILSPHHDQVLTGEELYSALLKAKDDVNKVLDVLDWVERNGWAVLTSDGKYSVCIPDVELPNTKQVVKVPWRERPVLWNQDIKIPCTQCSQDYIDGCYRDGKVYELVQQLKALPDVEWELHNHFSSEGSYLIFLKFKNKAGHAITTTVQDMLPETTVERAIKVVANNRK